MAITAKEKGTWLRENKPPEVAELWLKRNPGNAMVGVFYVFPEAEEIPERTNPPWKRWLSPKLI